MGIAYATQEFISLPRREPYNFWIRLSPSVARTRWFRARGRRWRKSTRQPVAAAEEDIAGWRLLPLGRRTPVHQSGAPRIRRVAIVGRRTPSRRIGGYPQDHPFWPSAGCRRSPTPRLH